MGIATPSLALTPTPAPVAAAPLPHPSASNAPVAAAPAAAAAARSAERSHEPTTAHGASGGPPAPVADHASHTSLPSRLLASITHHAPAADRHAASPSPRKAPDAHLSFQVDERHPGTLGSNGGRWFVDGGGERWFGKPGKGDAAERDRLGNEEAVNRAYHLASADFGTRAPDVRLASIDGKMYIMSKKLDLSETQRFTEEQRHEFGNGFVIDAWLANWDAGVPGQPVADGAGHMVRVDGGGGGLFRARGEPKGAAFGNEVTELTTMREPARPSSAWFRQLSDSDVKGQLKKFAAWYPEHRAGVEAAIDGSSLRPEVAQVLKAKLAARADYLIEKAER